MSLELSVLMAAKIVVLILGASISGLALLAHLRNPDPLMLLLAVAFGLVALGSFAEGLLFELLHWSLFDVHVIESAFVLAGLGTIAVLLRPRWSRT